MTFIDSISNKIKSFSGSSPSPAGITEEKVKLALSKVIDPDLHKDIVTLGFLKDIKIKGNEVCVIVNLTTPACPVKELLKSQCEQRLREIPGVEQVQVTMTASTTASHTPRHEATAAALGKVKNVIAVASGKGGVGKSTSTINIAYALAARGAKVGILDADVYGPSIPLMTAPTKEPMQNQNNMIIPAESNGIKVISIGMFNSGGNKAAILRGPMAGNVVRQFLTQVDWGELDYLLIDYPPGTGDIQLTISQTAPISGAIIITTPQEVALIDVRKSISMFETLKVPVLGVIETMSYFVCDGCDKKHFIFRQNGGQRLATEFGLPLLGQIPLETLVSEDSDNGRAVVKNHPQTVSAKAYMTAAESAAAQLSIINNQSSDALMSFQFEWKKLS